MKYISKFILPLLIITIIGIVYYSYSKPNDELGNFSKFNTGSEINQEINVAIVRTKMMREDANGMIISFVAKDKNNVEVVVNIREPAPEKIMNAKVIELLGHLHKEGFSAVRATIIR